MRFVDRAYGGYTDSHLGHQLSQVATLVWTRYRRDYVEIVDAFLGEPVHVEGADDRQFRDRLARLAVSGRSTAGWINVQSRALVHWEVTIKAGAVQALAEEEFLPSWPARSATCWKTTGRNWSY